MPLVMSVWLLARVVGVGIETIRSPRAMRAPSANGLPGTATVANKTQPRADSEMERKLNRNSRQLIATADA